MKAPHSDTAPPEQYIVAIGASAGGLEAIHEFFDNMPSNGNLSFIIIQHLSPDYKSLLVELISKHTHMQVREAGHDMAVEKNCVYVIPNNKLLTINNGFLQLSEKSFEKAPNTAIDTFFKSLAQDHGSHAIAIVLSGTGSDGTKGIASIQQNGGMVLVQDPLTAKFDGMPNSAINAGYADFILSPELMPEEIFNYIKERPVRIAVEGKPDESRLPEVLKLIERHCGNDFFNYKTPTILRRIGRRMTQLGFQRFDDYMKLLHDSGEECKLLGKEFLIGVTKFFRDEAAFDILRNEVLPQLVSAKGDNEVIKVWVTACSTGEEAYSMAMLFDDYLRTSGRDLELKIFASDLDIDSIEHAARGIYPASALAEMDTHLVERYFIRQGNTVQVQPGLRKKIVFARHNILKDPPFIKNDLTTCRNMLIYMNGVLQRKVMGTLHFSLNTGGYLFLGPSEIPAAVKEAFEEISGKWKIFRKMSAETGYAANRYYETMPLRAQREQRQVPSRAETAQARSLADDFRNLITEEYGMAALYLDAHGEVKEALGDFRKYLTLPDKVLSMNLVKLVPPDLGVAISTAIRKAVKEEGKVSLHNVRVRGEGGDRYLNIFVRPPQGRGAYTMVAFSEGHGLGAPKQARELVHADHPEHSAGYIGELEEELKETRINLQTAIESLETTNEELQSSNEELLSANEELQSSNEELQSLNEELHTLNTEHQLRIKELIELNDDLNNYFRSTEIAQVFLDGYLRIRKFNPAATSLINLIESDIGRPIDHISTNFRYKDLQRDISIAISTGELVEREVELTAGGTYLLRILPYVRQDRVVEGAVITFIDISRIRELNNLIKAVFDSSLSAVMAFRNVHDKSGEITGIDWVAANQATDRLLGSAQEEYFGRKLADCFPQFAEKLLHEKLLHVARGGKPLHQEIELQCEGRSEWYGLVATQMPNGLVITLTNIDAKRKAEEKFRKNYHELIRVKENYRQLNNDLEAKVEERTAALSQSEERFRLIANVTSDAIWDWDLVNNEVWWSDSFYSRFGHERGSLTSSDQWIELIHPEDRNRVHHGIMEIINRGSGTWSAPYRFRKADGSYAYILDRGAVLPDAHGTPFRMLGAMMDMTDMEMAEQKLREKNSELQSLISEFQFVTDFMPQMVWATRPDGYHDFYNKQWYDYTGLDFEQSKAKGWAYVLHPEDLERTSEVWDKSLASGMPYEIEYRLRRFDGAFRWFLARALPLRDREGHIIKWFGTCTDIHDQRAAADVLEQRVMERTQELQKANLELESSNAELLQFASIASHDLKEPLRKIHMFSNIVRDRYMQEGDAGLDYMNRIIRASARMTSLINDLLSFTRLSVSTEFERHSLSTLVSEVLSDLELVIAEKEAVVQVDDLPAIDLVAPQMRQVFQNLISNALKFSRPGVAPHIRVQCLRLEDGRKAGLKVSGPCVQLKINDNGIGFDNRYAEKIFTIFQRLHARENYEGTGIGLAITRKIIEKHNGSISAHSKEGEGSTFVIHLPLHQPKEEGAKPTATLSHKVR